MSFSSDNTPDLPNQGPAEQPENQAAVIPRAKPRVWTLFVATLLAFVMVVVLQVVAAVVVLIIQVAQGQSGKEAAETLPSLLMTPPMFVMTIALAGLAMTAGALLFGWVSARYANCSVRERLGMGWPPISTFSLLTFLLGSVPVFLVSIVAVYLVALVFPADDSLSSLYNNMTTFWAVVFIITIGVLPGIGEELFFRGYFQRRMLQRYRPWVAIGVTSVVFGLFHITPHGIALATIIGVWLGVIAWRTNSIWPSACCHAFINSSWNVYQVGRIHWGIPTVPPIWFSIIGGAVILVAFGASVWILLKMKPGSIET